MIDTSDLGPPPPLSRRDWLILSLAALGFAFDIYELLVLPLIARPALLDLLGAEPGSPEYTRWVGLLFFVPALCGGVFGLLGGYLADRFGRVRVLTWSILLYAGSAVGAGLSTSAPMLLFFRCTTFIGVCVEFVAAVAWIAELFPHPRRREQALGYTQAFSSVGGLLVTGANALAVYFAESLPAIHGEHEAWRYTLISGVFPAIPLIIIRPFLPESQAWKEKRDQGLLARPSITELFAPHLRRTTIVTTVLFACSYGAAFGALQHMPRIVPGLSDVSELERPAREQRVNQVQFTQEIGGLVGRFALAFLALRILSRRRLLRVFQMPGLVILPLVFFLTPSLGSDFAYWGMFLAGFFVVAQFSFWGNYLPRVYPIHLRGTGESFAANIGGRMIGTSFAMVTTTLQHFMPGKGVEKLAYAAGTVGLFVFVVGFAVSFFLPEPKQGDLPE